MKREVNVVAIAVSTLDGMVEANYQRALRLGELALASNPDIILFPEAFAAGYIGTDLIPYAEDGQKSPYLQEFRELSLRGKCLVSVGYLERAGNGVKNAVAVYDNGSQLGTHYKRSLWPDDQTPYRDEVTLMIPGDEIEVFETRFGRIAVLICYENMLEPNWQEIAGRVDLVLSPYNCEGDPSHNNKKYSTQFSIPSVWADRTGTVYMGDHFSPNMGTAGIILGDGHIVAMSQPGVEEIVVGSLEIGS